MVPLSAWLLVLLALASQGWIITKPGNTSKWPLLTANLNATPLLCKETNGICFVPNVEQLCDDKYESKHDTFMMYYDEPVLLLTYSGEDSSSSLFYWSLGFIATLIGASVSCILSKWVYLKSLPKKLEEAQHKESNLVEENMRLKQQNIELEQKLLAAQAKEDIINPTTPRSKSPDKSKSRGMSIKLDTDSDSDLTDSYSASPIISKFFVHPNDVSDDDGDEDDESAIKPVKYSMYKSNFDELKKIGQGGFGSVYLVRSKTDHKEYALKKISFGNDRSSEDDVQKWTREAMILAKLEHQNVVRYYNSWVEDEVEQDSKIVEEDEEEDEETVTSEPVRKLHILTEYYPGGTLADKYQHQCENGIPVDVVENHRILRQLVKGLSYLHKMEVLHRDLKPSNVFVARDQTLKIGDFGLSCGISGSSSILARHSSSQSIDLWLTTGIGSPLYSAPEQFQESEGFYGSRVDVFSLGIIFYESFLRPETVSERVSALSNLRNKHLFVDGIRKQYKFEMDMINEMTNPKPSLRPEIKDIKIKTDIRKRYLKGLYDVSSIDSTPSSPECRSVLHERTTNIRQPNETLTPQKMSTGLYRLPINSNQSNMRNIRHCQTYEGLDHMYFVLPMYSGNRIAPRSPSSSSRASDESSLDSFLEPPMLMASA